MAVVPIFKLDEYTYMTMFSMCIPLNTWIMVFEHLLNTNIVRKMIES